MNLPKNCIATKALMLLSALVGAGQALAAGPAVGTVTDLAGALLVKKADGSVKILSQKSVVESGDTLITEKDTVARIKFIDDSEVVLKSNSQFRIDKFSYEAAKKENDSAVFSLIRGGLRSVTGLVGKRSQDRFGVNTPAATIGIRGTTFFAEYMPETESAVAAAYAMASVASASLSYSLPGAATDRVTMSDVPMDVMPAAVMPLQLAQLQSPQPSGTRSPGLYVQVIDGLINVTNPAGSQNFAAGQFGFTPSFRQAPVIVPNNPGIQFSLPPSFSVSGNSSSNSGSKPQAVDCEVR